MLVISTRCLVTRVSEEGMPVTRLLPAAWPSLCCQPRVIEVLPPAEIEAVLLPDRDNVTDDEEGLATEWQSLLPHGVFSVSQSCHLLAFHNGPLS